MRVEKRKNIRFDDIGKVESPELCLFSGVLVDVSKQGCRVRFPTSLEIDTEMDYELKISPVRYNCTDCFLIMARPIWHSSTDDFTEIGFAILHSPSLKKYDSYVDKLLEEKQNMDSEQELLDGINID